MISTDTETVLKFRIGGNDRFGITIIISDNSSEPQFGILDIHPGLCAVSQIRDKALFNYMSTSQEFTVNNVSVQWRQ